MTYGEKQAKLRQCVIDESVYNMVSLYGDTTIQMITELLRSSWSPRWAPVFEVVTTDSVALSASRLKGSDLVSFDGSNVRIPIRDPRTRKGRAVKTDYDLCQLTWKGRSQ